MSSSSILELRGISKTFASTTALSPLDLDIERGSFVSIVGPSGCGKSTLFNILSGLIQPDNGSISLEDQNVIGATGHVGYMLQKDLLVPWRTVLGNITLGARLKGKVGPEDKEQAMGFAQKYGLGEFLHHYPSALSGGMRQRVALMRTLATNHQLLLLDEPFGALDAQTRFEMQQWLLQVWRDTQRTVLFITHDVDEAVFLSDRVLVMSPRPGRVVDDLRVDLPRPRTLDTLVSPAFTDLKSRVLHQLHRERGA
ncbi:MAG: ABC transporter ATP-binding protein [Actinomycetota bacterium]|jgi:ABC-type nitrate/sulfonate/bicarbonate transport system ATPase subunit